MDDKKLQYPTHSIILLNTSQQGDFDHYNPKQIVFA
jgi:hypothetical protein